MKQCIRLLSLALLLLGTSVKAETHDSPPYPKGLSPIAIETREEMFSRAFNKLFTDYQKWKKDRPTLSQKDLDIYMAIQKMLERKKKVGLILAVLPFTDPSSLENAAMKSAALGIVEALMRAKTLKEIAEIYLDSKRDFFTSNEMYRKRAEENSKIELKSVRDKWRFSGPAKMPQQEHEYPRHKRKDEF